MVLGNSVKALWGISPIWTSIPSIVNDDYTILVNWKWNLLTTYFWVWKRVFQIQNWTYFIRTPNSLPYMVVSSFVDWAIKKTTQWYVNTYLLCDFMDYSTWWSASNPQNCVKYNMNDWQFETVATRILNSLNNGWYYAYNYIGSKSTVNGWNVYNWELSLCFSSSEFNKSICFYGGVWSSYCAVVGASRCSQLTYDFYNWTCWGYGSTFGPYCTQSNLSNSQSLSPNFDWIPNSAIWLPPWNWNIVWWSTTDWVALVDWDVIYSECKVRNALNWYHFNWFSDKLCYWWLNDFSVVTWVVAIPSSGLDVEEIWFNTASLNYYWVESDTPLSYSKWFDYWRYWYNIYKKNSDSIENPFHWTPTVLFTYFSFIDLYWLQYTTENILNYCQLSLYTDDVNAPYTWLNSNTICNASLISYVDQSVSSQLWVDPVVGSSWEGITDRPQFADDKPWSWWNSLPFSTWFQNWVSFQNNFFNLLSQSFKFPQWSRSPALPDYIIIALVWLLFFRFIKK